MKVTIVEGNLLDRDVDVIFNAWSRDIIASAFPASENASPA
jgi:hypothetical protein